MHLLYLDEAGKSGQRDYDQPWYVLGGLIIHETDWQPMEGALNAEIDRLCPPPRPETWELHMAQIHHRKGDFKSMAAATRWALVDAVFDAVDSFNATFIFVGVHKQRLHLRYSYPDSVEDIAYRFMIERYDGFLRNTTDKLGLVVCDEQKQDEPRRRSAHSQYRRFGTGWQTIDHVIETPFFTPSHWSR